MKNIIIRTLCTFTFLTLSSSFISQNQSMTISHAGLSPNDTLWVSPGDSIDFIYGGGGSHPMTSGQGGTSSPVFFPTVTVTSSNTMETFALNTVGTYIFHCGTNPSNTANWGTIIVQESNHITEATSAEINVSIYPNPTTEKLWITFDYANSSNYIISDMNGKTLLSGQLESGLSEIGVSDLPIGIYQIQINSNDESYSKLFIKQ